MYRSMRVSEKSDIVEEYLAMHLEKGDGLECAVERNLQARVEDLKLTQEGNFYKVVPVNSAKQKEELRQKIDSIEESISQIRLNQCQ